MKKIILLLLFCLNFTSFAFEDVPLLIDTSTINIEVKQENNDLIDVNDMKKSNTVQKAKEENIQLQKPQIKLDTRQIHQQRTLQYMDNRGGSTMLPIF